MVVFNWVCKKKPLSFENMFGNNNPVILEIGFGNGEFLKNICGRYPGYNFIGVEVSKTCVRKAKSRLKEFKNVKILKCSGELFLSYMCPRSSLYGIFLNFPDPWFKKKHIRTKRFIRDYTVKLMAYCLKTGGFFSFLTDWEEYAQWVDDFFSKYRYFRQSEPLFEEDLFYTKYRRKWEGMGRRFYHLWYRKVEDIEGFSPIAPEKMEDGMHAVRIENINPQKIETKLKEIKNKVVYHRKIKDIPGQGVIIKFLKSYRDFEGKSYLVETLVKEPFLERKFFIQIEFDFQGAVVKYSTASGDIEITRIVKKAIDLLVECLSG